MNQRLYVLVTVFLGALLVPPSAPALWQERSLMLHHQMVDKRGDEAMGFSHSKSTHHFRLYRDGGSIGIEANEASDTQTTAQIRSHLQMIARRFKSGDFSLPMFIHATTPPGMKTLQRLQAKITYRYEETPHGAQVRLTTGNASARRAIHDFLRFQIKDHRTGDPLTIQ